MRVDFHISVIPAIWFCSCQSPVVRLQCMASMSWLALRERAGRVEGSLCRKKYLEKEIMFRRKTIRWTILNNVLLRT